MAVLTLDEFERQFAQLGGQPAPVVPPGQTLGGEDIARPQQAAPTSEEDVFVKAQQRLKALEPTTPSSVTTSAAGAGGGTEEELMQALIKARGRLAGTERGQVRGWGSPLDAARYLARSGVNLVSGLATPVIDPFTRAGMSEEQKAEDEALPVGARLANAVGRSQEAANKLLEYIGITPQNTPAESETIFARIGEDLVPAALSALAVTRGAPYVARMASYSGRVPLIARVGEMAGGIAQRPVTTAIDIIGTQPSATALRELASPTGEAMFGEGKTIGSGSARFLWDLGMEVLGGGLTSGLVRRGATAIRAIPPAERFSPFSTPTAPIIDRSTSPDLAAGVMRVQAATHVDTIDRMIESVIDGVNRSNLNTVDAGRELRGGLLAARDFAKEQSDAAYAALPRYLVVGTPRNLIDGIERQLGHLQTFVAEGGNFDAPHMRSLLEQLTSRGRAAIDPLTGQRNFRTIVGLDELITMRSDIDKLSRAAAETNVKGVQGNRTLKANLDDLHARITQDIEEGLTNLDPKYAAQWELANEMYRVYNQRFRQGPVGELLMSTRHHPLPRAGTPLPPGAPMIPNAKVVTKLLSPDETAAAVHEAVQPFFGNQLDPTLGARIQAGAVTQAEDAVRSMFEHELRTIWETGQVAASRPQGAVGIPGLQYNLAEQPARATTQAAERFIQKHEPLLRNWTRLTTDMVNTQAQLQRLLRQRQEYTTGLVYQFIGQDPRRVVSDALTSPNRNALFQQLYSQFRAHPDALEGMRRVLIDQVFSGHGADPTVALESLRSPAVADVMRIMFQGAEDRLARLYQVTQAASDIIGDIVKTTSSGAARIDEKGAVTQMGLFRRGLRSASVNMAGWFLGLFPAHQMVRLLNLGSQGALSVPARLSTFMRQVVSSTWIKNQVQALDAIRDAAFEPRLEAWMLNTTSGNWREQQANFKRLARLTRSIQASINGDVEEYINGNARRKAREDQARVELEYRRSRENPFKQ